MTDVPAPNRPDEVAPPDSGGRLSAFCFALIFLAYLCLGGIDFSYTVDDPLITYRYARNFAMGEGLVFNPGERVEGFTSLLHVLLMAAVYLLAPQYVILIGKALSFVFGGVMLWLLYRLGVRVYGKDSVAPLIAPLLLATSWRYLHSCVNGLETMLATALLVGGAVFLWDERTCRKRGVGSAVCFAGACLARPEGVLLLPVVMAMRRKGVPETKAEFLHWLAVLLAPVLAMFLFRGVYYQSLFPNTYYAKLLPLRVALPDGIEYVVKALFPPGTVLVWLLFGWGLVKGRRQSRLILPPFLLGLAAMVVLWSLGVSRSGGDTFPWEKRYMAPILPFAYLLAAWGVASIRFSGRSEFPLPRPAQWGVVGLTALAAVTFNTQLFRPTINSFAFFRHRGGYDDRTLIRTLFTTSYWLKAADWVQENIPPGTTLAFTEMGATPYFNPKVNFIDLRGLTDRTVARNRDLSRRKYGVFAPWYAPNSPLGKYLLERKPAYILDYDWQQFESPVRALNDEYTLFQGPLYWWNDADLPEPERRMFAIWKRK